MKKNTKLITLLAITLACALGSTSSISAPDKAKLIPLSSKKTETVRAPTKVGKKHQTVRPASTQLTTSLGKPDLMVSAFYSNSSNLPEGFPSHSYCRKNPAGGAANRLMFYIKNGGAALAPTSQVKIFFNTFEVSGGASSMHTANVTSVPAGQKKYMSIPIPANCYKPGFSTSCRFRIVADATYQVAESDEGNNYVDSYCVGPAG